MAKICLFTSVFYNNIGNAFIDIGAEETIKAAMGNDDDLVKISQCPFFATSMGKGMQWGMMTTWSKSASVRFLRHQWEKECSCGRQKLFGGYGEL